MSNTCNFKLFKRGSKGRLKVWMIRVDVDVDGKVEEVSNSGYDGMKLRESRKVVLPNKQYKDASFLACKKARTKALGKIREGYDGDKEAARNAAVPKNGMQALTLDIANVVNTVPLPTILSNKKNGVRCTYHRDINGLVSKGNLPYDVPHILKVCQAAAEWFGLSMIDMELFVPGMPLNEINSRVQNPGTPEQEQLQGWMFDCIHQDFPKEGAKSRKKRLIAIQKKKAVDGHHDIEWPSLKAIPTLFVKNYSVFHQAFHDALTAKDEGLVGCDPGAEYDWDNKNRRSLHSMFKVKPWYDAEFEVTGYEFEKRMVDGEPKLLVIFICKAENGKPFKATPEWDVDRRHDFSVEAPPIRDLEPLTVRFRERTVNELPFHAVAVDFRPTADCES